MIKIFSLWEGIRKRPEMYIGKKSIYGLQCFITGIQCAENMTRNTVLDVDWHAFGIWVSKKIRRQNNKPSFQRALEKADNDDEKAFDLWMSWYEEYERKVLGIKEEEAETNESERNDPHLY